MEILPQEASSDMLTEQRIRGIRRRKLVKGPFPARRNVPSIHADDPSAETIDVESAPAPGQEQS
jgi:hypothetical protein